MRTRLSTSIGLPVVDDVEELLGAVSGIFINPDTAVIEGVFVHITGFFSSETLFLPSNGIEHWGSRVRVRSSDMLSPLEDFVRLSRLYEERRPVYGQQILTDSGRRLGRCGDIQFNTKLMQLEWLFPHTFLRWGVPLPANAILQVTSEAIVVRGEEAVKVGLGEEADAAISAIESLTSTPVT